MVIDYPVVSICLSYQGLEILDGLMWSMLAVKNLIVLNEIIPHDITEAMIVIFLALRGKFQQFALIRLRMSNKGATS
jgi:hypothetical protein